MAEWSKVKVSYSTPPSIILKNCALSAAQGSDVRAEVTNLTKGLQGGASPDG